MPWFSKKWKSDVRLDGKIAIVTGSNIGLGKETVRDFFSRGCRVIMACRDVSKAEDAANEIRKEKEGVKDVGVIVVVQLDLSSYASVRKCAAHILQTEPALNILVNNAGVAFYPRTMTEDGYEYHFQVNHLSHFLFTLLLMPLILKSTPARIVIVSSKLHESGKINYEDIHLEKSYNPLTAYGRSKLGNMHFALELSKRLQGTGVTVYAPHPGLANTEGARHYDTAFFKGSHWIFKNVMSLGMKTAMEGAQTQIYCAVEESIANETGFYYGDCQKTNASSRARDPVLALRCWEESLKMTGLEDYDPFTADSKSPKKNENKGTTPENFSTDVPSIEMSAGAQVALVN